MSASARTEITLNHVATIPEVDEGHILASLAVSVRGDALFLFAETEEPSGVHPRLEKGVGIFPLPRLEQGSRYRLVIHGKDKQQEIDLGLRDLAHPIVDIFPDGRVLLAGARSAWRGPEDFDLNGCIITPGNDEARAILLGDGIESCQIDDSGRIWVSYFDEGIWGNWGWGMPGPPPISRHALNRFDDKGSITWHYDQSAGGPVIDDCYALNATEGETFFYLYSGHLLGRASADDRIDFFAFETHLYGFTWFAIDDTCAVISGGYRNPSVQAYLLPRAQDGAFDKPREIGFHLPGGRRPADGKWVARGDQIHYFDETGWYRIGLDEIE